MLFARSRRARSLPPLRRHARGLQQRLDHYIGGQWVPPLRRSFPLPVVNPADEMPFAAVSLGSSEDVDAAVAAARRAFDGGWADSSREERLGLLERLAVAYERRIDEMATTISREMGAPVKLARNAQAAAGLGHIKTFARVLRDFQFEAPLRAGETPSEWIVHEPVGVCGLITPWNWPMNQVALKVVPALAAGCTVVLKPSEVAPLSAMLFAEMLHEAGCPPGVVNLVNGDGATTGEALAAHASVDMVSFTGSTRAGVAVSKAAADTVKRVALELGGKGPNLIFSDADVPKAVRAGVAHVLNNSGQSCNAPTRMLVQREVYDLAVQLAAEAAAGATVGDPAAGAARLGPVASAAQWAKVQGMIEAGVAEGARLVAGGPGRPDGLEAGWYCRPTVFADVDNGMRVAREEIFGPVLCILPFEDEEHAVAIANDTPFGLTSYVQTGDPQRARRLAKRLRAGMVVLNGAPRAAGSPFGGVRQSGNGREGGELGLKEFLEVKAISGWPGEK